MTRTLSVLVAVTFAAGCDPAGLELADDPTASTLRGDNQAEHGGSGADTVDADAIALVVRSDAAVTWLAQHGSMVLAGEEESNGALIAATCARAPDAMQVAWLTDACGTEGWTYQVDLDGCKVGQRGEAVSGSLTFRTHGMSDLGPAAPRTRVAAVARADQEDLRRAGGQTHFAIEATSRFGTDVVACGTYTGSHARYEATMSYDVTYQGVSVQAEATGHTDTSRHGTRRAGMVLAALDGADLEPFAVQGLMTWQYLPERGSYRYLGDAGNTRVQFYQGTPESGRIVVGGTPASLPPF